MRGVNKAIIVGSLGKDPEIRYTSDGKAVANFSVATSESWKDKQTGDKVEKTEWHRIVIWGRLAEIAGEYLGKGSKVYLEGNIQTRKWTDNNGVDKYTTEIVANEMQMLSTRPATSQPQTQPQRNVAPQGNTSNAGDFGDFDSDIPF